MTNNDVDSYAFYFIFIEENVDVNFVTEISSLNFHYEYLFHGGVSILINKHLNSFQLKKYFLTKDNIFVNHQRQIYPMMLVNIKHRLRYN